MKIDWKEFNIKGQKITAKVTIPEKDDRELMKRLYNDWKRLNDDLKKIGTRGINLPESLSENLFCFFFPNHIRVVKLKKGKCSYDCLNTKTGSKVQIKASSTPSDLTSFGPKSEWDELYFLDFSAGDGTFKAYRIEKDWIYKHKVNRNQTFEEQQQQARRPRFSITEQVIKPRGLKPVKICRI